MAGKMSAMNVSAVRAYLGPRLEPKIYRGCSKPSRNFPVGVPVASAR